MAAKKKSRKAKQKTIEATTREHGVRLAQHDRAIAALTSTNRSIAAALKLRGVPLAKIPSSDQVRAGIADAMSSAGNPVKPGDLKDSDKLVINGGAGAVVQFLGKLNSEFWNDGRWHITPSDLKGISIGNLIALVLKRLGGK
jgi:hypothetical protein